MVQPSIEEVKEKVQSCEQKIIELQADLDGDYDPELLDVELIETLIRGYHGYVAKGRQWLRENETELTNQ